MPAERAPDTQLLPEEAFEEVRKQLARRDLTGEKKMELIKLLMSVEPADSNERDTEQQSSQFTPGPEAQTKSGGESDVITAATLKLGFKAGHVPETITQEEAPGITEHDRNAILIRHGKISEAVQSNMIMLSSYGPTVEQENNVLYDNNEIDQSQFLKNKIAEIFSKEVASKAVDVMSAVEGHRFEGLQRNISSGKLAHEELEAEAEKKRQGRLSRFRRFIAGEDNGE